ncbi:unnamed protein product [Rotaria socialis]|uniref:DAGKc domain-containing protein n=1 Tax=Rotaria socialis TaxID=392032 RepID=A0A820LR88_9BILA|nr:unnamed protein product [Rotaria socialis]CAF4361569.1 unnamed protein product [Rotaria socialis]
MSSTIYSTKCYIKNNPYQLSIRVDSDDANSTNNSLTTDVLEVKFTDISLDNIIPSITRLCFEPINEKKDTIVPEEISLNHLLSVQQLTKAPNKNKRNFNDNNEPIDRNIMVTTMNEPSKQTSCATLNTLVSENTIQQTPKIRRLGSRRRFFFNQSYIDGETDPIYKTVIKIRYVDVSNLVRWSVKKLEIEVETEDITNELYFNLNLCLSTLEQRPHKLLAFVNPFGGKGKAKVVFEKSVLPIFNAANIAVTTIHTERANQAKEYIMSEDLNDYDGIVCVGGDGMFAELCHGLLLRTSLEANVDIDDPEVNIIRPNLKIGIIPAGSTDAVAFGTTGLNDPVTSALQIIVGETLSIDIATVHNEKGFVSFMAVMLAYGFFGDIIQQSDKWRFLGPLRYDLAGFFQFIRNRSYNSEVTITLSDADLSRTTTTKNHSDVDSESPVLPDFHHLLNNADPKTNNTNQKETPLKILENKILEAKTRFCRKNCETCAIVHTHDTTSIDPLSTIKLEGRYTTINCLNMPGRCAKSKFGMSPYVHLGDGTFDLILVKRSWRTGFLRFLWQVAKDGRLINDLPNVEHYCAREVFIRPKCEHRKALGNLSCDGELISGDEIKIRIHRQVLNIFASGIQFDKIEENNPIENSKKRKCCPLFPKRRREHQQEAT